jgi:hypothetical protein
MADQHPRFNNQIGPDTSLPAGAALAVTPSDSTDLAFTANSLYVGGAGNVRVRLRDDTAPVTFNAVPAGTTLYIHAERVFATGTTATNIIALF